ncbi:hypothetical protein BpHYR1_040717 [Brachionus plicatilis]|uniref:Chromo domain-containing protein n=1 Tax=Brachionus plicatilis TaxID=10195 RepID=A0A3M7T8F0_BRAPC|nr:hypothetical protein BpHYR1_040717 [Brachionus plicatilis]
MVSSLSKNINCIPSTTDVWENPNLIHFIQFGKLVPDLILGLPETDEGFNERQIKTQNKSSNIVEKRIDIGKTNALNETLKDSYPRHKIKLVEEDSILPEESAEIERIQKHKIIDNDNLYLVKWKNLQLSESSWIPEKKIVDLNSLCKTKPKNTNHILNKYFELKSNQNVVSSKIKLNVLGKIENQIYGNGYHCLMKKHILVTSMSFWGEKFESLRTEPVKQTNDECKIMVITKKCRESPMNCDAEYCTYSANPKATFSWLN